MRRLTWGLVALALGGAAVLVGAASGVFGPLVVCGVDRAPLCVAWPVVASAGTWLLFLGFVVGLAAWQIREWRSRVP
jgi:hypothetical protein